MPEVKSENVRPTTSAESLAVLVHGCMSSRFEEVVGRRFGFAVRLVRLLPMLGLVDLPGDVPCGHGFMIITECVRNDRVQSLHRDHRVVDRLHQGVHCGAAAMNGPWN